MTRAICWLDESQTGLGRLGTMYGFEHYGVVPDLLVLLDLGAGRERADRHASAKRP